MGGGSNSVVRRDGGLLPMSVSHSNILLFLQPSTRVKKVSDSTIVTTLDNASDTADDNTPPLEIDRERLGGTDEDEGLKVLKLGFAVDLSADRWCGLFLAPPFVRSIHLAAQCGTK